MKQSEDGITKLATLFIHPHLHGKFCKMSELFDASKEGSDKPSTSQGLRFIDAIAIILWLLSALTLTAWTLFSVYTIAFIPKIFFPEIGQ